jgi:hypothetical protein
VLTALLAPSQARADDIPSDEEGAFGEHYSLLDVTAMMASGTRRGSGDVDYTRKGTQLEYRVGGFLEENYFGTQLGLEAQLGLGYQGENDYEPAEIVPAETDPLAPVQPAPVVAEPYSNTGKSALYFRTDVLFTYGLLHWKQALPGRLVFGLGGGFEYAPRFQGGEGGEGYGILLGRLQLWPNKDWGLHLTATTNIGSYRAEALASYSGWTFGARVRWLNSGDRQASQEQQLEGIVGLSF